MIVPPVAHRREIDRNLAEFFRGHRAAHFNRAISSMCRFFNLRRPRIEWFEYIDWGKTAGRTYEDGRIHLVHPENWKRGRVYFSERLWIQMIYHEMGHFLFWTDAERKADAFLAPDGDRASKSPARRGARALATAGGNLEHASRCKSGPQAPRAYFDRTKIEAHHADRRSQISPGRLMPQKPNVENRWWVETTFKKPKTGASPKLRCRSCRSRWRFYQVARDYDQDRAKEDLTDNNLRIAREANPPQGDWAYVAMTEEHAPPNVIKRVKDEFRIPREARGIVIDHGRVVRLLICGPQLEDWMLDITLGDEPSVDAYVWSRDVSRANLPPRRGRAAPGAQMGHQPAPIPAPARRALPRLPAGVADLRRS